MRSTIFRTLAGVLGVAWIALGAFAIANYGLDRPMRLFGGIAIIGAGIYLISYCITGRRTLIKQHLGRQKR